MKVMSPVGALLAQQAAGLAPRKPLPSGGIVGLLSNGKPNAHELLETAFTQLQARLGVKLTAMRYEKHVVGAGSGSGTPRWLLDKLAAETVAVIAATGD